MRPIFTLSFAVLALGVVAQQQPTAPRLKRYDEKSAGKTIHLRVGQRVWLSLPANASTGYAWSKPSFEPEGVVELKKSQYVKQAPKEQGGVPMVGGGGHQFMLLFGLTEGKTELTAGYSQPWDKEAKPVKTFTVKFFVHPAGN